MADNNQIPENAKWIINNEGTDESPIYKLYIIDRETNEVIEVKDVTRDSLELNKINENGTIGEMIDTINSNFKNIAIHGGGPAGVDGVDGFDGVDGTNIEYIYCLCNKMNPGEQYPSDDAGKNSLFERVHFSGYAGYPEGEQNVVWYEHAQPISEEHKNEFVLIRYKLGNGGVWAYAEKPILWAHWGENGNDGDGVEYIFLRKSEYIDDSSLNGLLLKKINMDKYQKAIYQIDDFCPGKQWFIDANKAEARRALNTAGASLSTNDFNERWGNYFNMIVGGNNWTDNPTGTTPSDQYEYVAIRRSKTDENGIKEWTDYSKPAIWSHYGTDGADGADGKSTRIFIVYCNMPIDEEHPEGEKPNKPEDGTGKWVNTNDSNTLDLTDVVDALTDVTADQKSHNIGIWLDDNIDVDNTISWMCSGIFTDDGNNISWSQPFRITGKDGAPGEDGDNIQFVYCLSDGMPAHPVPNDNMTNEEYDAICAFFDAIENAKKVAPEERDAQNIGIDDNGTAYYNYNNVHWYDNPQGIDETPGRRTEWVWQRSKAYDETRWTFMPEPVIWSHWGEDGTDGDGVEYIFHLSQHNPLEPELGENPPKMEDLTGTSTVSADIQRALLAIDDFFPDDTWFTRNTDGLNGADNKAKAKNALVNNVGLMTAEEFETLWSSEITNETYFGLDYDWTDDPLDTSFDYPFEFVSIRRSHPNELGKREWGDFEPPKFWTKYLIQTRVFMVYCNVNKGITPTAPDLNYGWWAGDDRLVAEENSSSPYRCPAYDKTSTSTQVGTWVDSDEYESGKIAWLCSITFAENGVAISCSEPFRVTGDEGTPGADGSTIQFVYARCDVETDLKYPNPDPSQTPYATLMAFFDAVENAKNVPQEDRAEQNVGVDDNGIAYYNYQGTHWYDNPQGISDEDGKRKEWVWSRNKNAGDSSSPWTTPPKPVIWSHWGEDGTDGDGIEYIFCLGSSDSFPVTEQDWNAIWTGNIFKANDTAKAVYNFDDFVPNSSWFNDNHKNAVSTFMHDNALGIFVENDFTTLGSSITSSLVGGSWTDNPSDVTVNYPYQFVSIRKCKDGVWGPFSYPKIWGNYSASRFTSFAFTATETNVNLSDCVLSGGNYDSPLPTSTKRNNVEVPAIVWTDGPEPDDANNKVVVWMTSAKVVEGQNITSWSSPQKMVDTTGFQIEWCAAENIPSAVKASLESSDFNFENYLKDNSYDPDAAEEAWRSDVYNEFNLSFGDGSNDAIYMATCQYKKGGWTNWTVSKVKGEKGDKGDAGTSISVKGRIAYEVHLDDNTAYTYQNAYQKFLSESSTLSPVPVENNLLIVYPALTNSDNIYYGDSSMGGALYMWKYSGTAWFDYNNTDPQNNPNGETEGSSYVSPNKHLILWDSDSWQDIGKLEGPEGKRWVLVVKYANDDTSSGVNPGDRVFVTNDADIPGAKWMGTLTYLDDGTDHSTMLNNPNFVSEDSSKAIGWTWSLFKGQDGYGYEYIYYVTQNNSAPDVPQYSSFNDYTTANVVPTDWRDEPVDPNANNRFVWMCWRKFNTSTGRWSEFMGKYNKTHSDGGKAKLWQLFADSIESIEEYYHADTNISPIFNHSEGNVINSHTFPSGWSNFWHDNNDVVGVSTSDPNYDANVVWDDTNKHLFNVEVVKYTNGSMKIMDPHYISMYDTSIQDIEDYYILGTSGSTAPHITYSGGKYNPDTGENAQASNIAGIDYWTPYASQTTINEYYQYLWNISKKTYGDGDNTTSEWTTPIVIGVFGAGQNGENAVYLDIDNEMDVVQINEQNEVVQGCTCISNIKMYSGSSQINIKSVLVAGEDNFTVGSDRANHKFKLYYSTNGSSWTQGNPNSNTFSSGSNVKYIKMTLGFNAGDSIPGGYAKIQFTITSENYDIRTISYTLTGTTNPSLYSISLSSDVIIKKENGNADPSSFSLSVVKNTGGERTVYTSNQSGEGGFQLYMHNGQSNTLMSSYTLTSSYLNNLSIGDKLVFNLYVDTDDNDTYPETVMDTETVYVIGEGKGYDDTWLTSILGASTTISGGLMMTGDLLVRNQSNNITAGVLGYNTTLNGGANNIRFFAGNTNISDITTATAGSFVSAVNNASFRVTESGLLNATNAIISGSITATQLNIGNYNLADPNGASNWVNQYVNIPSGTDISWLTKAFSSTAITGGLITTGDILAADSSGKITAGMLGYNSGTSDIRFFAGTTAASTSADEIISAAASAPFHVDEQGNMYATKGYIGPVKILSDRLIINDKYGNETILTATGIKVKGAFSSRCGFLVSDLGWADDPNSTTLKNLKKNYDIYSAYDTTSITDAFSKCDILDLTDGNLRIPDDSTLIGRRVTLMVGHPLESNIMSVLSSSGVSYSSTINGGTSEITFTNSTCKFYEDGNYTTKLKLSREAVELFGIGIGKNFKGFIVTNRYNINTVYDYGHTLRCLGMCLISSLAVSTYSTFNGVAIQKVSSTSTSITLSTPFKINSSALNKIFVTIDRCSNFSATSLYSSLSINNNNYLQVTITGSSDISSASFKLLIYNTNDFQSLSLSTDIPPGFTAKEYRYDGTTSWKTLGSGFNWGDTDINTVYVRLTKNPSITGITVSLRGSDAQSFELNGVNSSGSYLTFNVKPKGKNTSAYDNDAYVYITYNTNYSMSISLFQSAAYNSQQGT